MILWPQSSLLAVLNDASGTFVCASTISFVVVASLSCAPAAPTGPVIPRPSGNTVYLDQTISTTIIQQITVNIVNIQNVVNINQITCVCCFNSCNNNFYPTPNRPVGLLLPSFSPEPSD